MAEIHRLDPQGMGCDTYIVESEGETLVIDPGLNGRKVEDTLERLDLSLDKILLTHVHFDHSAGASELRKKGVDVFVHEAEARALEEGGPLTIHSLFSSSPKPCKVDVRLREGDKIAELEVINTPGHSPGSICFLTEKKAFVGDVVFPGGSFGRTDLPQGNRQQLRQSIKRLSKMGKEFFYSGHGGKGEWSDIGKALKMMNSFL